MAGRNSSTCLAQCRVLQRLLLVCLALIASTARATEAVHSERYGVVLFYYYQEDYLNALTELMVAQQLGELNIPAENAELLRGGMSLSFGMDGAAADIFETLLAGPGTSIDRDQAWFYLGKMAWQRDEPERAAAALAKMDAAYTGPLAPEADYLRASIALRRGNEQQAADYAGRLARKSPWPYYLYYNLGATRAANADWPTAVEYFHRASEAPVYTAEINALRDKALTASGYALLAAKDYDEAIEDFTQVRLDSPLVDRALLGYGWASGEMQEYQAALSPWQALGERSVLSDSVRESLLAIPYAYEKLGLRNSALKKYSQACEVFVSQSKAVRAAVSALGEGDLSRQAGPIQGVSQDWLSTEGVLPVGEHLPYVRHLVTERKFQVALRELQDLHQLAFNLSQTRLRLQMLAEADEAQRSNWAAILGSDRLAQLKGAQHELLGQADELRSAVLREQASTGNAQLANDAQSLQMLAQESQRHLSAVEAAVALRQRTDYVPRISALQEQVVAQEKQVQVALKDARERINQVAVAQLQQKAAKLDTALGQCRLAVARLYDSGNSQVQP
ncbi:MAG: hypothetical protein R3E64_05150 [Halioglobus sp.]